MNFFDVVFIQPLLNLMVVLYHLLVAAHVPYAVGFSIILLTIVIRFLLYPFMHQSLKQQKKMQQLTPHINKLKEKHKGDAKQLQVAQMELFKSEGVNPASGCALMLVQLPVLISLYNVLLKVVHAKSLNDINHYIYTDSLKLHHVWDTSFFGLSLGKTPGELLPHVGFAILLVGIITGGLQLLQSRMMMLPAAETAKLPKKTEPDFATTFQTQSMYLLPVMVGFFAHTLPFGLSLYWNTLTIFGIMQQYRVQGWGGLVDWFPFLQKETVSKYK
jgi:YidC/Oxa1 family membrane protein insertase